MKIGYKALLEAALAEIETIKAEEARGYLGHPDYVFVDLRDIRELIPTLRVSGAKRAPHLPRQGARPRDLYLAFGSLLGRFGIRREGKIPGAFHAPRGMLEFWVDPESPYHKPIFASGKKFVFGAVLDKPRIPPPL